MNNKDYISEPVSSLVPNFHFLKEKIGFRLSGEIEKSRIPKSCIVQTRTNRAEVRIML